MYKSRNVRKRTFRHVHPVKIQIRLCIRAAWSEFSLSSSGIARHANCLYPDNDGTDQTVRMRRMISFLWSTCQNVRFLKLQLIKWMLLCHIKRNNYLCGICLLPRPLYFSRVASGPLLSVIITKTCLFKYTETFATKNRKFSDKKFWYFSYFCSKHRLWVLVRTASTRRF